MFATKRRATADLDDQPVFEVSRIVFVRDGLATVEWKPCVVTKEIYQRFKKDVARSEPVETTESHVRVTKWRETQEPVTNPDLREMLNEYYKKTEEAADVLSSMSSDGNDAQTTRQVPFKAAHQRRTTRQEQIKCMRQDDVDSVALSEAIKAVHSQTEQMGDALVQFGSALRALMTAAGAARAKTKRSRC